jgi:hypothetical protein
LLSHYSGMPRANLSLVAQCNEEYLPGKREESVECYTNLQFVSFSFPSWITLAISGSIPYIHASMKGHKVKSGTEILSC